MPKARRSAGRSRSSELRGCRREPEELRPILDAFRAPGVSFLRPPPSRSTTRRHRHQPRGADPLWRKIGSASRMAGFRKNFRTVLPGEPPVPGTRLRERRSSFLLKRRRSARHLGRGAKRGLVGAIRRRMAEVAALIEASREHWEREREGGGKRLRITNDYLAGHEHHRSSQAHFDQKTEGTFRGVRRRGQ